MDWAAILSVWFLGSSMVEHAAVAMQLRRETVGEKSGEFREAHALHVRG
jgi:hypothetical protein